MNKYQTITPEMIKEAKALLADRTANGRPLISLGHETRTILESELTLWNILQRGGFVVLSKPVASGELFRVTIKIMANGRRFAGQKAQYNTYGIGVNK